MTTLRLTTPYTRGEDVLLLQQLLLAHGYSLGSADGIFGANTDQAVRAFQKANGLTADGIVGAKTWAALQAGQAGTPNPDEKPAPTALAKGLCAFVKDQLCDLYVWGGNGQTDISAAWIEKMDSSASQAQRSIKHWNTLLSQGVTGIRAFDCSGLISRYLQDRGLVSSKRNCNHLWRMSKPIKRAELIEGDLVFRGDGSDFYHVGVYVGYGRVVEAKGRDDGVVIRGINASGSGYWTHCARLEVS